MRLKFAALCFGVSFFVVTISMWTLEIQLMHMASFLSVGLERNKLCRHTHTFISCSISHSLMLHNSVRSKVSSETIHMLNLLCIQCRRRSYRICLLFKRLVMLSLNPVRSWTPPCAYVKSMASAKTSRGAI